MVTILNKEDCVIRLAFGSMPTKVIVRLGTKSNLIHTIDKEPRRVSCIWDNRLRSRPRQLRLTTRTTTLLSPRMSNYHGRYLYA